MNKIIAANLKSSLDDNDEYEYIEKINKIKIDNLIICPGNKYLNLFKSNNYKLAMQDIDYFDTVKDNAEYALLGHYSRRSTGDSNKIINEKIKLCLENNLKIILCIGNDKNDGYEFIINQINECLVDIDNINNIIFAYEPYYMINKDIQIDYNLIEDYIKKIKQYIYEKYHINASVLYGGNVNEDNFNKIINISDGVLIGRLCFNVDKFTQILHNYCK